MATVKTKRKFRDIDLSMRINPFTRDLYLKTDEEAIKTAVKHLILTKNFERPFKPELGTQVHSLLFENFTPAVRIALERSISDAIEKFEPRVRLSSVNIKELQDGNNLEVTISFMIINMDRPVTITTLLSRIR